MRKSISLIPESKTRIGVTLLGLTLLFSAPLNAAEINLKSKPASVATVAAQQAFRTSLPNDNGQDAEFVKRGFIATIKDPLIRNAEGKVVWDVSRLDWVKGDAPDSVNPSLWRQTKLLKEHGLFEVTDNVWQVRGIDMANMTIVRGNTGWIIIDPLFVKETAAAALKLVNSQLGKRPVSAVIYSHSHTDHFGGVRGVINDEKDLPIYAPEYFMEEAVSELVIAGNVVSRRAGFQMGTNLQSGPRGAVSSGILTSTQSGGTVTLIPPTQLITKTGEKRVIDGVEFEFQMVPETEAPAEMNIFLPKQKTYFISEIATCTMHNIQTPRGALIRDANRWASFLTEALNLYGDRAENLITGHCWPRFGSEVIKNYIALQRDNYKFMHDQAVRRFSHGDTPTEAALNVERPKAITDQWSNRDYYGTVKNNVKGVYQRYVGWWDGIPAHLDLPPTQELSAHYVRAIGGPIKVLKEARRAMKAGEYRWAANLLNDLVFTEPDNARAKALLADAYEQLGYQTESGIWRNYYLTGAAELRGEKPAVVGIASPDMLMAMPIQSFLDLLSTRLNPDKVEGKAMTVVVDITDDGGASLLTLRNGVLVSELGKSITSPTVTVRGKKMQMMRLLVAKHPIDKLDITIEGDRQLLVQLLAALESPPAAYPIVLP